MGYINELTDQLNNVRVLVTGGAGFVGCNLVKALLGHGAFVTVLDDFFTGRRENLPQHNRLVVVPESVADYRAVAGACEKTKIIFHLAARNIIVSTANPREDYEVNIGGTLNVLLAAREHGVSRVVCTSSASVYGNPRHLPINEEDSINLLSPYAVSKYAAEGYCRSFYESYGLSTSVVRYSNVYGIMQRSDNPYCGVISKFFQCAMDGLPLRIHGDGEQTRDFTYVTDAVYATMLAGLSPKADGQVYNVGTGKETSVYDLARKIHQTTGTTEAIEYIDRRDIDNIRRRAVNIEKIRRDMRWIPMTTLTEGLRRTYEWMTTSEKAV